MDCKLRESTICHNINAGKGIRCERCFVKGMDTDKQQNLRDGLSITQSLLPEGGIDWMKESDECLLCQGDREKASCYGVVYMAHPEPPAHKRLFFGIGKQVRNEIGSLIPVELAACTSCRRRHFWIDFIRPFMTMGLAVVALLLFLLPGVADAVPFPWPLVAVGAAALLGAGVSIPIRDRMVRSAHQETAMSAEQVPTLKEMVDLGWTPWSGGAKDLEFPIDFRSRKTPNKYDPS